MKEAESGNLMKNVISRRHYLQMCCFHLCMKSEESNDEWGDRAALGGTGAPSITMMEIYQALLLVVALICFKKLWAEHCLVYRIS